MKQLKQQLRAMLLRTLAMSYKELMHILRDKQMLGFALVMPVMLILLFGFAVSFDVERVPLVLVDQDHTPASRALADAFTASRTFEVVAQTEQPAEAERMFRSGAAKVALVVPAGFAKASLHDSEAVAQLLVDGADNTTASVALGYANAVALASSQRSFAAAMGRAEPPIDARVRTFFNPGLKSSVFLVPGLMVMVLSMMAVMLTALTVAREYERGSMEQLFATPVGRLEVMLGKLGPYFVIGEVQVLLVLTLGVGIFDVPVQGSVALVFAVSSVFLLAMLMQGMFISVMTRNQMLASQIAAITTFLPSLLLSGFIFPIDSMPPPLRVLASILPPRYLVHGLRAVLLRGVGFADVVRDMAPMLAFFLVLLALAARKFRREVA
jgi:ABC-2 type transport system permease protein